MHQKTIAEQFGVSKFALSRHRRNSPAPIATNVDGTGNALDVWLARANEIFIQASVDGNLTAQISSLSAAVRTLQAEQRNVAKRQEQEKDGCPHGITVEELDESVRKYLDALPPGACFRCGAPTCHGTYTGPIMPGTFPALTGRGNPEQEPNQSPKELIHD